MKTCTRLGCPKPATHRLQPDYCAPWYGCADHKDQMAGALALGQPQAFTVEVTPV